MPKTLPVITRDTGVLVHNPTISPDQSIIIGTAASSRIQNPVFLLTGQKPRDNPKMTAAMGTPQYIPRQRWQTPSWIPFI